jgi:hypothetical protein
MTVQFDTLKFKKKLTGTGIAQNQAEGITEAVKILLRIWLLKQI